MGLTLIFHIVAGSLGLVSGFTALYSGKGTKVHRKAGMIFVGSMLAMCAGGVVLAIAERTWAVINVPAGLLSAYLVVTSLNTVKPAFASAPLLRWAACLMALSIGVTLAIFGIEAVANGGSRNGIPAFPLFLFALVGILGGIGDLRVLRSGPLTGPARLARHLWRMTFALWIAAMSFFIGQADVIPEPYRIRPLLALPVVAVLFTMFYWLWRVRVRRSMRALALNAVKA